ncbi:serine hydrolase domain-containing protein [Rhizobium terrae]|uniref:serine hydrolase domain-containing protein n=1 Tax=Rhizobium terrae TaxID=2171756 RepID=UPI000E3C316F|nr:serine hydrolase [Rhizobium terrae]
MEPFSRSDIILANWRTRPYSSWSFQNASELVPSAVIAGRRILEKAVVDLGALQSLPVEGMDGKPRALETFLEESDSDAFLVMRKGEIVAEWYAGHCNPARPHMVFSISKSITSLIAGNLVAEGRIALADVIADILPASRGSAYGDATFEQLINMSVSLDFEENYLDRTGAFDRYRRAMLWNPDNPVDPAPDLKTFLCTIPRGPYPHGSLHAYHSPNTDVAGILLEIVSGRRFGELLETHLWQPLGALGDVHLTLDKVGNPRASAGLSMTARDLARIGEMMRQGGGGMVPETWVADIWAGGNRETWATGSQAWLLNGGSYRYYWYWTGTGAIAAIGIHGQWLWIDPKTETVIVRLASEPVPVNDDLDHAIIKMLAAVSAA